jgi:molecular chaperone DnaK
VSRQPEGGLVVHGIDFGTSTSMIMVGRPGATLLQIKDPLAGRGETGVPSSVCARPNGSLAVGLAAERIKLIHIQDYRTGFKQDIGRPISYRMGGVTFSPDDLMAAVLRFLRERALAVVAAEPAAVVLTVPARWQQWNRDLAVKACAAAGYDPALVHLADEPVAAMASLESLDDTTVIYDLGGGTFDCAVAIQSATGPEIYGDPGGLPDVGGRALDGRVLRHVRRTYPQAEQLFAPETDAQQADGPDAEVLRRRIGLREKCTDAKIELSDAELTEMLLAELDPPEIFSMDRAALELVIGDLVDQTVQECARMLEELGLPNAEVGRIIQIGGSSRIPLTTERLATRFGCRVRVAEEPDLAVARGAAELALRIAAPPLPPPPPSLPRPPSAPEAEPGPSPAAPHGQADAVPAVEPPERLRQFDVVRNPFLEDE